MLKYLIISGIALIFSLFSCKDQNDPAPVIAEHPYDVIGHAQKGPFINGSDVDVYELDNNFKQTGRSFHTTTNEQGYFELNSLELVSPYIEVMADGIYYNEVSGDLSNGRIILKAIIDLSTHKNININILTNLEFERVKYLVSSMGTSFKEAKIQSQNELLNIFNINNLNIEKAEILDIVNPGAADAALLAISCILQANRTTGELIKLQADIILDMKKDGILSDTLLQSALISRSVTLNPDKIRQNIIVKYKEYGLVLTNISDFDKYINYFNLNSDFHYDSPYQYPESTSNGLNILDLNNHKFEAYTFYAMAVKVPDLGNIKVKIKKTDGIGSWWSLASGNYGWNVDQYDNSNFQQIFTSTVNGEIIDLPLVFTNYGTAKVEYYCKSSESPTFIKNISWGDYNDIGFEFKDDSNMGQNLLAFIDSSEIKSSTPYVIGVFGNREYRIKFKLKFPETVIPTIEGGFGHYNYNMISGVIEFELASSEFGDTTFINGLSEIGIKFKGTGKISIESNLLLNNGQFLKKIYSVNL